MTNEIETHEEVCAEMRSFGDKPPPMFAWRDLADRAEAAHKRELEAKDAEIEQRKIGCGELLGNLMVAKEKIEKRDALIKELAETLESYLLGECIDCGEQCEGCEVCEHQVKHRALVVKARVEVKNEKALRFIYSLLVV